MKYYQHPDNDTNTRHGYKHRLFIASKSDGQSVKSRPTLFKTFLFIVVNSNLNFFLCCVLNLYLFNVNEYIFYLLMFVYITHVCFIGTQWYFEEHIWLGRAWGLLFWVILVLIAELCPEEFKLQGAAIQHMLIRSRQRNCYQAVERAHCQHREACRQIK